MTKFLTKIVLLVVLLLAAKVSAKAQDKYTVGVNIKSTADVRLGKGDTLLIPVGQTYTGGNLNINGEGSAIINYGTFTQHDLSLQARAIFVNYGVANMGALIVNSFCEFRNMPTGVTTVNVRSHVNGQALIVNRGTWHQEGEFFVNGGGTLRQCGVYTGPVPRVNGGGVIDACSPLPVTLVSFKAVAKGAGLSVAWVTAYESNVNRFEVELSQDGREFRTVAKRNPVGKGSYVAQVDAPGIQATSTVYLRLRTVDNDGITSVSNVVAVKLAVTDEKPTYYNMQGQRVSGIRPGEITVLRYPSGRVEKIYLAE